MNTSQFTQENRFLELTTPLGKDVLLPNSFTVSERVSSLYRIDIEVLYKGMVDPKQLLGQDITLKVQLENGSRYFHGIISEIDIGDETERFRRFRIAAVPKLWLMTLTKNFRVFENKSVADIIREVLNEFGIVYKMNLRGSYTPWDHCVQFRETYFDFISRLMEHEGVFYYFTHDNGKHTMMLVDSPAAYTPCPDQASAHYAPEKGPMGDDYLVTWQATHELRSGSYRLYDFHFERSTKLFTADADTVGPIAGNTVYKIADSPGSFTHQFNKIGSSSKAAAEGEKLNLIRMEEVETHNPMFRASSYCRAFSAGHRFNLIGSPNPGDYSITSIDHVGMQYPPYVSGMEASILYSNTFTCVPFGSRFRPERTTPKPSIVGPQTATVIDGPDKYSRVKVKFHWGDELNSAWVRVAQRWCGPGWGTIFIPRVGHEVIIEFIDGDPDQPLIVGSVYNAQNMPPYELPANKTQSGIKTRSMDAGGGQGGTADFNELRFEDKKGQEDIYFHAQKDFHRFVENDDDLKVEHDQTIQIKNHRTETVQQGNEKVTVQKGNRDVSIDMGNDTLTVKMGNHIRKINLGKSETEAMQSIELKVGQSSVKLDQAGVTIKGIMVKIEGTAMLDTKAPMCKHQADAMMMIKGGITMIN